MKRILERLKGARGMEIFLALAAVSILVLLQMNVGQENVSGQTQQEIRLSSMLECVQGAGRVQAMISETGEGVLIVADGADDLAVCIRLQYAAQTLLDTEASRIEVVPRAK